MKAFRMELTLSSIDHTGVSQRRRLANVRKLLAFNSFYSELVNLCNVHVTKYLCYSTWDDHYFTTLDLELLLLSLDFVLPDFRMCKLCLVLPESSLESRSRGTSPEYCESSSPKVSHTWRIAGRFEISTFQHCCSKVCMRGDHLGSHLGRWPPVVTNLSNIFFVNP